MAAADHIDHAYLESKTLFGFWVYLMTDCILFTALFATYAVLHKGTAGGVSSQQIIDLPYALGETLLLLVSSFTCGVGMRGVYANSKKQLIIWFMITFLLGAGFLFMELKEFAHLVHEGNSWERSAFLSSFFTLVGTHGFHISLGLIWMGVMMGQVIWTGFTPTIVRRLKCFRLFWHFLDVVWIFIFTVVFLMGVL